MITSKRVCLWTLLFATLLGTGIVPESRALLLQDERGQLSLDAPGDWKVVHGFFGFPHALLGPEEKAGRRAVLGVTLTGKKDWNWDKEAQEKSQNQYREGRKLWAEKRKAEIEEFFPYSSLKTTEGVEVHAIGFEYTLEAIKLTEMSWFVECPKSFTHLKGLAMSDRKPQIEQMKKMVLGLRCGK